MKRDATEHAAEQARNVERIAAVVRAVPQGEVRGYAQIARAAGLPRHARLVVRVLNLGLELPWYRIVRADGRIAFPAGSDAFERQRALLESEGVAVRDGRVQLPQAPDDSLDAALWG
jgi:methylated-DNA-protein-cysteine methyltransferase related protein